MTPAPSPFIELSLAPMIYSPLRGGRYAVLISSSSPPPSVGEAGKGGHPCVLRPAWAIAWGESPLEEEVVLTPSRRQLRRREAGRG
jgi:hypothetical protein